MKEANYNFWDAFENLTLLQAAYLWCGFEPPVDELENPSIKHKNSYFQYLIPHVDRLKPKPLPQDVKLIFIQLINAIKDKRLKLITSRTINAGSRAERAREAIFEGYPITPKTINIFSAVYVSRSDLKAYAESIGQTPVFLLSETEKANVSLREQKLDIIRDLKPGIESIWEAILEVGLSESDGPKEERWRESALNKLSEIQPQYPLIRREFLDPGLFQFNIGQERRDFIGKLLNKILKANGIIPVGSYVENYALYKALLIGECGRRQTDMSEACRL